MRRRRKKKWEKKMKEEEGRIRERDEKGRKITNKKIVPLVIHFKRLL